MKLIRCFAGFVVLAGTLTPAVAAVPGSGKDVCEVPGPSEIFLYKGLDGKDHALFPGGEVKDNVTIRREKFGGQTLAWIKGTWRLFDSRLEEGWLPAKECTVTSYSAAKPIPDDLDQSQMMVPDRAFNDLR